MVGRVVIHHEALAFLAGDHKIPHQQNVAIDVAEQIVSRDGLSARKHKIQSLCSKLGALYVWFVVQPQLLGRFRRAFLIAKPNHFHAWLQLLPSNSLYFSCCLCDAMISSRIVSSPRVIFQLG